MAVALSRHDTGRREPGPELSEARLSVSLNRILHPIGVTFSRHRFFIRTTAHSSMAYLQILFPDGSRQSETLNEREPLTIGRHATNSIVVDNPHVPMLLARILWNRKTKGYEITAAALPDLNLSGQQVRAAILKPGDTLQVGDVLIRFSDEPEQPDKTPPPVKSAAPVSQAPLPPFQGTGPAAATAPGTAEGKASSVPVERKLMEPAGTLKLTRPSGERVDTSVGDWLTRSRRPGERDALRSPLVSSLTIAGVLLLVATAALYLMIGRQTAQANLAAARADRDAGKFGQAIQRYEKFLDDFPASSLAQQARVELSHARIHRALHGASSDPNVALSSVEEFIEQHRSRDYFRDWYSPLADACFRIATLAFRQAGKLHDPAFVQTGDQARLLFGRFKATDGSNDEQDQEIEKASRMARAELLEFDVRQQSLASMDQQLRDQDVAALLNTYRRAVARYPVFATQEAFTQRVRQALELERSHVQPQLLDDSASSPRPPEQPEWDEITLLEYQLSRFDIQSDGQAAWLLSAGNCFGVDRLTGKPLWKIATGTLVPFEPIEVNARHPAWLIATDSGHGLALVNRETGEVLWRILLGASCLHAPTLASGMAYLVTDQRELLGIELETGQTVARMTFPQAISAPPALLDEQTLLAIAEQDVFYFIDRLTWTCREVRYHGHAPGSLRVQPFLFNDLLLVVESDQLLAGSLRILAFEEGAWDVKRRQSERLPGIAIGAPVPWGNRLFLETFGPRVAAWQLSDDPGDPPLRRITVAPLPFTEDTRLFLKPAEGDRLLVAGETLRELTLLTAAFEQKDLSAVLGQASQSLQLAGTHLQVAGRIGPDQGTIFLHYDYDLGESYWRMNVASVPLWLTPPASQAGMPRCINANGQMFDLSRGKTAGQLRWVEPLEQLFERPPGQPLAVSKVFVAPADGDRWCVIHQGQQARLINPPAGLPAKITLSGIPARPVSVVGQSLFWCDAHGVHQISLGASNTTIDSWTFPSREAGTPPPVWQDLVAINETSLLGLFNQRELLALQQREDPRRYLGEVGSLTLPASVVDAGSLVNETYYLALANGQLLALDTQSLVVRRQAELPSRPTAGPWSVADHLFVEIDTQELLALALPDISQVDWKLPLSAPLAISPIPLNETQLLVGLTSGELLLVEQASGRELNRLQLPASLGCRPRILDQSLLLGLRNGTLLTLPLQRILPMESSLPEEN